jgi:hypothetical protein
VGSWRDLKLRRKYPRLAWAGWRRHLISVSDRGTNCFSDIFTCAYLYYLYYKFSIYLFSKFLCFYFYICFINPDYWLIRVNSSLINPLSTFLSSYIVVLIEAYRSDLLDIRVMQGSSRTIGTLEIIYLIRVSNKVAWFLIYVEHLQHSSLVCPCMNDQNNA